MNEHRASPDKNDIALLPAFERLQRNQIELISDAAQADRALAALSRARALGFDTESKPTFARLEVSDGPHIVQLSTLESAYVFQLHDAACRHAVAMLLESPTIVKAGFGLGDDRKRIISKLGVDPQAVLDLNDTFRQQGFRKELGVRGAVAVMFGQRFIKSKKAATSNWAQPQLTDAQIIYAANDAYAAMRVFSVLSADR